MIAISYYRDGKFFDFLQFGSEKFARKWIKMLKQDGARQIRIISDGTGTEKGKDRKYGTVDCCTRSRDCGNSNCGTKKVLHRT